MKIYRTSKKFTELEQWILHGVDPQTVREELKPLCDKRKAMQAKATEICEALGHKLFEGWAVDKNRCRKCGLGVNTPNVMVQTSVPDVTGAATMNQCNVNLDKIPENYFNLSDYRLRQNVILNKPYDTSVI